MFRSVISDALALLIDAEPAEDQPALVPADSDRAAPDSGAEAGPSFGREAGGLGPDLSRGPSAAREPSQEG